MKQCKVCGVTKDLVSFPKESRNKDGLSGTCSQCHAERKRLWAKNNPDKMNASRKKFILDNPEKDKESKRKHYLKFKEHYDQRAKEYAQKNAGWKASCCAKRRALKFNATPKWADMELIKDVYAEAKYFNLVVDHIVPLKHPLVCGLHVVDNLQLLTASENSKKHNKFNIEA